MNPQHTIARITMLAIFSLIAISARAQTFSLTWYTLDSGGAIDAAGANLGLDGTAGQVDGVRPMFGAPNELRPGFWGGDPPCIADLTGDYTVDLSDFFAFFNCFDISAPCADLDGSGSVDLTDFFAFFNAFDASC